MAPIKNNFRKNILIQKYLEKTVWDNWKTDDDNENNENNLTTDTPKRKIKRISDDFIPGIGFPSLDFLHEIQKSISYKLGKRYKYYSNVDLNRDKSDSEEEQVEQENVNDREEEEHEEHEEEEEEEINNSNSENDESDKNEKEIVNKKRKKSNNNNNNSSKKIKKIKKEYNRYPLSEPSIKPTSYNELCGPDVLMSLGILHQQLLISEIKKLNSYNDNINKN